ncbi:MAG: hypothetical protein M1817_001440 [Caeruleum heppii]|nr:MAG: hypothetical protein M1817_001440 [Caeruleum heppii]
MSHAGATRRSTRDGGHLDARSAAFDPQVDQMVPASTPNPLAQSPLSVRSVGSPSPQTDKEAGEECDSQDSDYQPTQQKIVVLRYRQSNTRHRRQTSGPSVAYFGEDQCWKSPREKRQPDRFRESASEPTKRLKPNDVERAEITPELSSGQVGIAKSVTQADMSAITSGPWAVAQDNGATSSPDGEGCRGEEPTTVPISSPENKTRDVDIPHQDPRARSEPEHSILMPLPVERAKTAESAQAPAACTSGSPGLAVVEQVQSEDTGRRRSSLVASTTPSQGHRNEASNQTSPPLQDAELNEPDTSRRGPSHQVARRVNIRVKFRVGGMLFKRPWNRGGLGDKSLAFVFSAVSQTSGRTGVTQIECSLTSSISISSYEVLTLGQDAAFDTVKTQIDRDIAETIRETTDEDEEFDIWLEPLDGGGPDNTGAKQVRNADKSRKTCF